MTSEDDKNTSYDSHPEVSDQSEGEEELDDKYRDPAGDQEIPGEKLENDEGTQSNKRLITDLE